MQSSFCACGHEVWWGELEGELVPFVRFTHGYDLIDDNLDPEDESTARALRNCFRPHAEICDSREFTNGARRISHPALRRSGAICRPCNSVGAHGVRPSQADYPKRRPLICR